MANTMPSRMVDAPRKMLSARIERPEATGKILSDDEIAREFGRDIQRTLEAAGYTPQEVAHLLRYANQSPISKLINPTEPPALAKMLSLPRMLAAWIEVLADRCPEYRKVVTLERKRA